MYRVLFLFVVMAFLLSGCLAFWVPNKYWKAMDCYSGEYTGLDTLINIDGYYSFNSIMDVPEYLMMENGRWVRKTTQSVDLKIKFWPDGFVIRNFYFECGDSGRVSTEQTESCNVISGGMQGIYSIHSDTIKVQTLYWSGQAIGPIEYTFVIRNGTSISLISTRDFARRMTNYERHNLTEVDALQHNFSEFAGTTELNRYLYIKHRKKFYCNEELYNEYLKSLSP